MLALPGNVCYNTLVTMKCQKCEKRIPKAKVERARRVGTSPVYCSKSCRQAAKQQRYRDQTKGSLQDRINLRNLAAHGMIAAKLLREPRVMHIARENLTRWVKRNGPTPALEEWVRLLEGGNLEAILTALVRVDEEGMRLRSSSPFSGVLSDAERSLFFQTQSQKS